MTTIQLGHIQYTISTIVSQHGLSVTMPVVHLPRTSSGVITSLKCKRSSLSGNLVSHVFGRFSSARSKGCACIGKAADGSTWHSLSELPLSHTDSDRHVLPHTVQYLWYSWGRSANHSTLFVHMQSMACNSAQKTSSHCQYRVIKTPHSTTKFPKEITI